MVKIDMDMPDTCAECLLECYDEEYDWFFCPYSEIDTDNTRYDGRLPFCPLIEESEEPKLEVDQRRSNPEAQGTLALDF